MKSNEKLGFLQIARYGDYEIGQKDKRYRAYGYEWNCQQDASKETAHHHVCGRGNSPLAALDMMIRRLGEISQVKESGYNQQTLHGLTTHEIEQIKMNLEEYLEEYLEGER